MPNKRFCVIVADCHALNREALCALLARALPDAMVLEMPPEEKRFQVTPDIASIILYSLRPPFLAALEHMEAVRSHYPDLPMLLLSDAVDGRVEQMARARGAGGIFHTKNTLDALLAMMRHLMEGRSGFPAERRNIERSDYRFTPRQAEVLDLLCRGKSNKEIGIHLKMSEFTVRSHVSAIFNILGTRNRTEAVLAGRSLVQSAPEEDFS